MPTSASCSRASIRADCVRLGLRETRPSTLASMAAARCSSRAFSTCTAPAFSSARSTARCCTPAFFLGSRAFYRALARDAGSASAQISHDLDLLSSTSFMATKSAKRRARVKARFINDAMMATLARRRRFGRA